MIEQDKDSKLSIELLNMINRSRELHMVPAVFNGKKIIRFCVNYELAKEDDIGNQFVIGFIWQVPH